MTKEQILKEFAEKITDYGYYNNECGYYVDWKDGVMPIVEKYANIIIAQTREETIREVEEILPGEANIHTEFPVGWNNCRREALNRINKLKKYETIRTI